MSSRSSFWWLRGPEDEQEESTFVPAAHTTQLERADDRNKGEVHFRQTLQMRLQLENNLEIC